MKDLPKKTLLRAFGEFSANCRDGEHQTLEGVAVRMGLIWVCSSCRWKNPYERKTCEDCGARAYKGRLSYMDEHDNIHPLREFEVFAKDVEGARDQVMNGYWDERLTAASCKPVITFGSRS